MLLVGMGLGCGSDPDHRQTSLAVVYGPDDRQEYFEVSDPALRAAIEQSVVALLPRASISTNGSLEAAPSLGDVANLCPGELYAEQPAVALCTGVLVDWDLVLTAGHCMRVLSHDQLYVAFRYFYTEPGTLALSAGDLMPVREIVAESLSDPTDVTRIDYAWLRLEHAVGRPRQPLGIRSSVADVGEPLVSIGAALSVPIKAEAGGHVRDARAETRDYFVADTDTSGGSSGGPALDAERSLLGSLARGGVDLELTDAGCARTRHVEASALAEEQFTYAARALEGLCTADPSASSLCRADCGEPCVALAKAAPAPSGTSCSAALGQPAVNSASLAIVLMLMLRRWQRSRRPSIAT